MQLPTNPFTSTALPIPGISENGFASMTVEKIGAFLRENEDALQDLNLATANWVVIDQKGLETSTCLVCEHASGDEGGGEKEDEEGEKKLAQFRACRIPYEHAWNMFSNLDVANMGFEEFIDEDKGAQEDGSWKWMDISGGEINTEAEDKRRKALKKLREQGHVE
jgi:hypothetical protein